MDQRRPVRRVSVPALLRRSRLPGHLDLVIGAVAGFSTSSRCPRKARAGPLGREPIRGPRTCFRRGSSDSGMDGAPFAGVGRSVASVVGVGVCGGSVLVATVRRYSPRHETRETEAVRGIVHGDSQARCAAPVAGPGTPVHLRGDDRSPTRVAAAMGWPAFRLRLVRGYVVDLANPSSKSKGSRNRRLIVSTTRPTRQHPTARHRGLRRFEAVRAHWRKDPQPIMVGGLRRERERLLSAHCGSQPSNQTTRRTPSAPCRFDNVRMIDQTAPQSLSGTEWLRRRRPIRKRRSPSGHSVPSGWALPAR